MLVKIRKRSQITIPASIVGKLNLKEGDIFDCVVEGENIILVRLQTEAITPIKSHSQVQRVLLADNEEKESALKKKKTSFRFSALEEYRYTLTAHLSI